MVDEVGEGVGRGHARILSPGPVPDLIALAEHRQQPGGEGHQPVRVEPVRVLEQQPAEVLEHADQRVGGDLDVDRRPPRISMPTASSSASWPRIRSRSASIRSRTASRRAVGRQQDRPPGELVVAHPVDQGAEGVEEEGVGVVGVELVGQHLRQLGQRPGLLPVEQRAEQLVEVGVGAVDDRPGDAGLAGDRVDRDPFVALAHDHLDRGVEQLLAAHVERHPRGVRPPLAHHATLGQLFQLLHRCSNLPA